MVDIPKSILKKLHCSRCEGYLSISPVMVTTGAQICGKCFKILPEDEKRRYVREIGLEAVAEMLIFPCRYHQQGCRFEILFNSGEDHERECPHRHNILLQYANEIAKTDDDDDDDDDDNSTVNLNVDSRSLFRDSSFSIKCQSTELRLESKYSLKQNNQSKNNALLKYTIDVNANSGYALCLQSEQYLQPVEIKIKGAVALKNTPENIYCEIESNKNDCRDESAASVFFKSKTEHVYESVNSRLGYVRMCNNCYSTIVNEAFYCQHGHCFCRKCRENACLHCTSYVSNTPLFTCKNYTDGCKETLCALDIRKHQEDCEFNRFQCLVNGCDWTGILKMIKLHVLEKHTDNVVDSTEISRKSTNSDDAWFMFAYENIFKCKYYYYENFVEFLVIYIGSHDKANRFKYEIEVICNYKTLKKIASCIGWNSFSLESGIAIQNTELTELTRNKYSCKSGFHFTLRISESK